MTPNLDFKVTGVNVDAVNVLCAQLMRDRFVIAKFVVLVYNRAGFEQNSEVL